MDYSELTDKQVDLIFEREKFPLFDDDYDSWLFFLEEENERN